MLKTIRQLRAHHVEQRADLARDNLVPVIILRATRPGDLAGGILGQLPDLLIEGHFGEERFHAFVEDAVGQLRVGDGNRRGRDRWLGGPGMGHIGPQIGHQVWRHAAKEPREQKHEDEERGNRSFPVGKLNRDDTLGLRRRFLRLSAKR